jgi:hypothetical protein
LCNLYTAFQLSPQKIALVEEKDQLCSGEKFRGAYGCPQQYRIFQAIDPGIFLEALIKDRNG